MQDKYYDPRKVNLLVTRVLKPFQGICVQKYNQNDHINDYQTYISIIFWVIYYAGY